MSNDGRIGGQSAKFGLEIADTRQLYECLDNDFDLSNGLVDTTITSPPYADVKNYEADEDVQIGFGQSYNEYIEDLRDVYRQVYEVTKDTGSLWIVVNTIKKDGRVVRLPFDIVDVCENLNGIDTCEECNEPLTKERDTGQLFCPGCGWEYNPIEESWRLEDIIIWDKNRARPWSRKGQLRNVYEYILFFSKSEDFKYDIDNIRQPDPENFESWWVQYPERYNPRGKVPHNIWDFTTPTQGSWGDGEVDHPAPFPPGMVERIIHLTTDQGDVVLDPFAGTGSVLSQAEAMGRKPLGFELSEEYADMYRSKREQILDEWENNRSVLEDKQEVLSKVICKLRHLKYPRELTRRVRKELDIDTLESLKVNTVFHLAHDVYNPDKFDEENLLMEADTIFVVDDDASEKHQTTVQDAARKCASIPPCSKFGIKANVDVVTIDDIAHLVEEDDWQWSDSLYLYTNDQYNDVERRMKLSQWWSKELRRTQDSQTEWRKMHAKNEYPPIFSNLEISIPDPERTTETVEISDILVGGVNDYPRTLLDFLNTELSDDSNTNNQQTQKTLSSDYDK